MLGRAALPVEMKRNGIAVAAMPRLAAISLLPFVPVGANCSFKGTLLGNVVVLPL